jgi:ASC-1-like (ASCH) protein
MSKTQKIVQINVQEPYLGYLKDGTKTIEGRLNKGKFKEIKVGDILEISGNTKQFNVTGKRNYKTFLEMVTAEGFEKVIPDKTNETDAANVYYKFFTKDQENEFGVLAIEIELVK